MSDALLTYFDYAASTPLCEEAKRAMVAVLEDESAVGNPHATSHQHGLKAAAYIQKAAMQVSLLLNCKPQEVIWTSGATEAINLAIRGCYLSPTNQKKRIITCETEHKAVLATIESLESHAADTVVLGVNSSGQIDLDELAQALSEPTCLVSIMSVNNETGVIQPIHDIAKITHEHGALLHVDATQTVGKLPLDFDLLDMDMLSLSGHKFYGPKGAGALVLKQSLHMRIAPQITGGGQQRKLRSGTVPVHQVAGLGAACETAMSVLSANEGHAIACKLRFIEGLKDVPNVHVNGEITSPYILNISIADVNGESLQFALMKYSIAAGSACTTESSEPSYVLKAMGVERSLAAASLRISFGRQTSLLACEEFATLIKSSVEMLRQKAGVK